MEGFSVDKIAALAYLELKPQEKADFQKQFDAILEYVNQLQELEMKPEEAKKMGAFHITTAFYEALKLDPRLKLRDENKESEVSKLNLTNEEAMKNAPRTSGIPGELLYEVPSIIERG